MIRSGFYRLLLISAALSVCIAKTSLAAGRSQTIEDASPQEVMGGMSQKTVRGIANVATGWLELPKQIYLSVKEDGAVGAAVGPLKGIGMTVVRTVSGAGELLTFFFPLPGFYSPFFEPGFVWQKE